MDEDDYEGPGRVRRSPHIDHYARGALKTLEEEVKVLKTNVSAFAVALFGHPQDKSDSGIVGNVVDTRKRLEDLNDKVDRIVWGIFTLTITGIIAVIVEVIKLGSS